MVHAVAARIALPVAAALIVPAAQASASAAASSGRTLVVLFPAFHFTKLLVTVHNQTVAPDCPRSGAFEDWFQNDHPSSTFSQVCEDRLLTLRFDADREEPMSERFSNQPGVAVTILGYSFTQSAPFYEPLYQVREASGYVRNRDIRVAGYDARLTPDIGDFVARTMKLI